MNAGQTGYTCPFLLAGIRGGDVFPFQHTASVNRSREIMLTVTKDIGSYGDSRTALMKYSILAVVSAACLFSASALHAQTTTTTRTTISKGRTFTTRPRTAPVVTLSPRTDGVVPRAIRSGQPLQMINPFAPAAYGSGQENARHEPNDPYARPQGIKLATVEF